MTEGNIQNTSLDVKYEGEDGPVHTSPILSPPSKEPFVSSEEEKRLVRKLDMHVMLTLAIIYLFACKSYVFTIRDPSNKSCS